MLKNNNTSLAKTTTPIIQEGHVIASGDAGQNNWRIFKPNIDDDGTTYELLRQALKLDQRDTLLRLSELASRSDPSAARTLRAKAASAILRDLLQIGWEFRLDAHWIYLRPPSDNGSSTRKESIRKQLLFGRDDQLSEDNNRRFIFSLERPSRGSSARPVTELIADGRRLHEKLLKALPLNGEERVNTLKSLFRPYLQLVTDERDEHTNIRLIDIWRYFRHSWSNRYRSSPGRNLFYLVRDAAQPNHPVMGIAALGNTVMQLTPRDKFLGWSLEGLQDLISRHVITDDELLKSFEQRLTEDYSQIFLDDLPVSKTIADNLSDDVLSRLAVIEEDALRDRVQSLRSESTAASANKSSSVSQEELLKLTLTPLYRSKRARTTREILRAYRILTQNKRSIADLLRNEDGQWAAGVAIKQLKKRHSATTMMEITVCGAVPPYNFLLGGKLVCLMMMSPRVIQDYQTRYKDMVSVIASQMAGRPISKVPHLAFLGTTSLYTDYSAQYNRVRLPEGTVRGQRSKLEYRLLGKTEGFGSPNLSTETEQYLALLAKDAKSFRNVNFVFGEGQSPKLRQLREGFGALGLDQSNLLNHGSPRLIYGVELAHNLSRVLLGIDQEPQYSIDPTNGHAENEIAEYWISRWVASRLNHDKSLSNLSASSPLKERVSRFVPERIESADGQHNLFANQHSAGRTDRMADNKAAERLQFIRFLYKNGSAFSDHVPLSRLKELNVRTRLEEVVRKIVRANGSVVITGNAGDGKTHTIMLMKNELKDAEVITDASELKAADILQRWQSARDEGRAFCIAINEGPLVDLIRAHRNEYPWLSDIQLKLLDRVSYRPLELAAQDSEKSWKPTPGDTTVIDLSLRRVLSPDLSRAIIEKLTDDHWYEGCA